MRSCSRTWILLNLAGALLAPLVSDAAPRLPASDAEVVERLPTRAADPRAHELRALRAEVQRAPQDADAAVRLARRYFELAAAEGDPRYAGQAQAALRPWWGLGAPRPAEAGRHPASMPAGPHQPLASAPALARRGFGPPRGTSKVAEPHLPGIDPPPAVRVMRAVLLQYEHQFDAAVADLEAALRVQPEDAEAWSWLAAIHMVRADYAAARRACDRLAPLVTPLIGVACTAYVDSLTGRAAAAAQALRAALAADRKAASEQSLWALTRLAEIEALRGAFDTAEAAFKQALALGLADTYLLAAYADFLLDRGRPAEVLPLLKDRARADVLLLRLAIAGQASGDVAAAGWTRELASRFDAARARGDTSHQKEESRFVLAFQGRPPTATMATTAKAADKSEADAAAKRALELAAKNWAEQREPADARILLEAAAAARQPAAAAPVLKWMADAGIESVVLKQLAAQLGSAR